MPQQINLYDDTLRPRREPWRAAQAVWAVAGVLALGLAATAALESAARARLAEAERLERQLDAERLAAPAVVPTSPAEELERLRRRDAAQRRVQAELDAQWARAAAGYTPFLMALSRQAHPALWITGFGVSADGAALEIQGRMTDAGVLPDYLRRLNGEAQFKGRRFEQLSVRVLATPEAAGATEFVLRSERRGEAGR